MTYDIAVIGGGIVGFVCLAGDGKFPRLRVVVLEEEAGVARHQSGQIRGDRQRRILQGWIAEGAVARAGARRR